MVSSGNLGVVCDREAGTGILSVSELLAAMVAQFDIGELVAGSCDVNEITNLVFVVQKPTCSYRRSRFASGAYRKRVCM